MPARRILVASPVEPSGGSWLLNCFLELGIKVGHKPFVDNVWRGSHPRPDANHIWIAKDGGFELNPKAASLTTFLPILARQTRFSFRDDVEVEYVQDFPARTPDDRSVVLDRAGPARLALFHVSAGRAGPLLRGVPALPEPRNAARPPGALDPLRGLLARLSRRPRRALRGLQARRRGDAPPRARSARPALRRRADRRRPASILVREGARGGSPLSRARPRRASGGEPRRAGRRGAEPARGPGDDRRDRGRRFAGAAAPRLRRPGRHAPRPIRSGAAEPRIPLHLRRHPRPRRNRRNPARHGRIGARSLLAPRLCAPARRRSRRPRRPSPRRGADAAATVSPSSPETIANGWPLASAPRAPGTATAPLISSGGSKR